MGRSHKYLDIPNRFTNKFQEQYNNRNILRRNNKTRKQHKKTLKIRISTDSELLKIALLWFNQSYFDKFCNRSLFIHLA